MSEPYKALMDCYAELTFTGTGQDLNPTQTPVKITDFTQEISSTGAVASSQNDNIKAVSPGAYDFFIHIVADVVDTSTYALYLVKGDTVEGSLDVYQEKKDNRLHVIVSPLLLDLIKDDAYSLYVSSDQPGGAKFQPIYLKLKMIKAGF